MGNGITGNGIGGGTNIEGGKQVVKWNGGKGGKQEVRDLLSRGGGSSSISAPTLGGGGF